MNKPILSAAILLGTLLTGCGSSVGISGISASIIKGKDSPPYTPNYHTGGEFYWPKNHDLVYKFDNGNSVGNNLHKAADNGISKWNNTLSGVRKIIHDDKAVNPDIDIHFVPKNDSHLDGFAVGGNVILGKGDITRNVPGYMTHVDIYINENQDDATIEDIACHEFGHALGQTAHSPNNTDVMYQTAHYPVVITQYDWNSIRMLSDPNDPSYPNYTQQGPSSTSFSGG